MIKRFFYWLTDHVLGTYAALFLAFGVIFIASATSYDVHNNPQMFLNAGITTTQTTGITLAPLKRNGETVTFPTTTGGVLRIRQGTRTEDIHYTSASVNASTNITTLSGVTRDLCFNQGSSFISCSNGQAFSKGATVELSIDARLLNLKVNHDRANTLTASGAIRFSGSGSFSPPTFATTAERDRQLGASEQQVRMACVTATGLCYLRLGGVWTEIGDTGTSNATLTTSGKLEAGTVSNISGAVITDDSGAPVAITSNLVIRHSTGAINNRNKVVATNNTGYLSGSVLGTSATSGDYLRFKSNGQMEWQAVPDMSTVSGSLIRYLTSGDVTMTMTNPTFINVSTGSLRIVLPSTTADTILHIVFQGYTANSGANAYVLDFSVNGTRLGGTAGLYQGNEGTSSHTFHVSAYAKPGAGTNVEVKVVGYVNGGTQTFEADSGRPLQFHVIKIEP